MSLRQKILFVSKEDNCGYSETLAQDRFLHTILVGLRNDNIKNELRPLLKVVYCLIVYSRKSYASNV